ncbi:hypothetical protein QQG55_42560 [Brugia pahangi]
MYILLLGIITNTFASIVTQQNSSEVLEQIAFYLLNISSSYDINSTNVEWNMLKYLMHPKANEESENCIYLPALIGLLSALLT